MALSAIWQWDQDTNIARFVSHYNTQYRNHGMLRTWRIVGKMQQAAQFRILGWAQIKQLALRSALGELDDRIAGLAKVSAAIEQADLIGSSSPALQGLG